MLNELLKHLDIISPVAVVAYVVLGRRTADHRDYVLWFLILQIVLNGIAGYISECDSCETNLPVYHANVLLSFWILSVYFSKVLTFRRARALVTIMGAATLLFYICSIFWQGLYEFPSLFYSFVSTVLVLYCLLFYKETFFQYKTLKITKYRSFWHVTGLFTYFTANFSIFISYSYLTKESVANQWVLWFIHNVVMSIMCGYLIIGYRCSKHQ